MAAHRSSDRRRSAPLLASGEARRREVAQIGVARVIRLEAECGRIPKLMPPRHEGFDVECSDADCVIERVIEVKSLEGAWTEAGVSLTKPQLEMARQLGREYWLYVVEHTLNDERCRIHTIQDPYGQARRFVFDPGWLQTEEFGPSKQSAAT